MYKNLFISSILGIVLLIACKERKPFVEHKLKFEKKSDTCTSAARAFKLTSNVGGERYEFEWCLPRDFTKEQMTVTRNGDSVVVNFKKPEDLVPTGIFNITLDIDSYPKYSFLRIDEDTYEIRPTSK